MSKPQDKVVKPEVKQTKVELNDTAVSLAKDPKTGKYVAVTINYDLSTGQVGTVTRIEENPFPSIIKERVKILVAQYLL